MVRMISGMQSVVAYDHACSALSAFDVHRVMFPSPPHSSLQISPWQTSSAGRTSVSGSVATSAFSEEQSRTFLSFRRFNRRNGSKNATPVVPTKQPMPLRTVSPDDPRGVRRLRFPFSGRRAPYRTPVMPVVSNDITSIKSRVKLDSDTDDTPDFDAEESSSLHTVLAALMNDRNDDRVDVDSEPCTPELDGSEQQSATAVRFSSIHTQLSVPSSDACGAGTNAFSGAVIFSSPDGTEGTLSAASASAARIAGVGSDAALADAAAADELWTSSPAPDEEQDVMLSDEDAVSSELSHSFSDASYDDPPYPFVSSSSHVELSSVEISTDVLSMDSDEQ
eukprot:IDg11757t1